MPNITRSDLFDNMLDDVFKGFFVRPVHMEGAQTPQIKVDVRESDKSYIVHAEIPGVRKEDIHVTIDGNVVNILAEVKGERETTEGEKLLRRERYIGKVSRAFSLAQDIDDSQSSAKYQDGVLELVLPKRAAANSRKLSIQ